MKKPTKAIPNNDLSLTRFSGVGGDISLNLDPVPSPTFNPESILDTSSTYQVPQHQYRKKINRLLSAMKSLLFHPPLKRKKVISE